MLFQLLQKRALTDQNPISGFSFWTLIVVMITCRSMRRYSLPLVPPKTVMRATADPMRSTVTFPKTLQASLCIISHILQLLLSIMKRHWHRFQKRWYLTVWEVSSYCVLAAFSFLWRVSLEGVAVSSVSSDINGTQTCPSARLLFHHWHLILSQALSDLSETP